MVNELPGNWEWSIGESSRPLSKRGYYLHPATKRVWANQYHELFVDVRIDTVDMPPKEHVVEMVLCKSDGDFVTELRRLASDHVDVIDPEREASQRWTEKQIHERARELMQDVENGEYDLSA